MAVTLEFLGQQFTRVLAELKMIRAEMSTKATRSEYVAMVERFMDLEVEMRTGFATLNDRFDALESKITGNPRLGN